LPSIDDHVWHIVVRGYGEADQQADVCTTMLVYGGVRAYWTLIGTPPKELPISYVEVGGQWRVIDVAHGLVFRARSGALATPEDVMADHEIIRTAAAGVVSNLEGYMAYFRGYRAPIAPDVLRADLQMPGRRLLHEVKGLVGLQGRVWNIRQQSAAAQGARP
jgi:hypothetical protein